MRILNIVVFVVATGLVLPAQTFSPNVCAIQNEYDHSAEADRGLQATTQIVVIRGRAVFSPRGFWVLTEPGCAGVPLADVLEGVKPKVSFQLIKDDKYRELTNERDRSRHDIVVVEVEGRLDRVGKKARKVKDGGSGAIHIAKYNYMLVLRQVRAVQVQ